MIIAAYLLYALFLLNLNSKTVFFISQRAMVPVFRTIIALFYTNRRCLQVSVYTRVRHVRAAFQALDNTKKLEQFYK